MPIQKKSDPERFCAACNNPFIRLRINGRLENRSMFLKKKYCNRKCMAAGMKKENPTRSALLKRVRHLLKSNCEGCGTPDRLGIHHKDRNWRNNNQSNLQTLCASCHTSLHHANGDIVPRATVQPCKYCSRPMLHRSVCNTCRTRIRRYGTPFPAMNGLGYWTKPQLPQEL